jgi:methionyl-tRNA formyltransferase
MTSEPDRGDIVDQIQIDIDFTDTGISLFRKVVEGAAIILRRSYPLIAGGSAPSIVQDESQASYFGKRTPADGLIDWNKNALEIYNLVRATTHPFPGAFSFLPSGKKIFIWQSYPTDDLSDGYTGEPGTIVSVDPLVVKTGRGFLRLDRLQLEGDNELSGVDFAASASLLIESKFTRIG